jgi:hypothetical protein
MDILQEARDLNRKSFLGHVFSTTEEGKSELLNVIQYASLGILPIVVLNKLIQRFVPEADTDKSSLELLVEIFAQVVIMFCGIILIHRMVTYVPTYSGFKYENLALTHVILAFLVIVLSIQTKLGIKVNILVDRAVDLWNGPDQNEKKANKKTGGYSPGQHIPSQADFLDSSLMQSDVFPPAPVATMKASASPASAASVGRGMMDMGPQPANTMMGGGFGSFF